MTNNFVFFTIHQMKILKFQFHKISSFYAAPYLLDDLHSQKGGHEWPCNQRCAQAPLMEQTGS